MPTLIPAELNSKEENIHFGQLLTKDVIITYAFGSVHEKFGVSIKAVPKSKFPAELRGKNGSAVPN